MSTAVAVEELPEVLETAIPSLPDEADWQLGPVEHSPGRRVWSTAAKAIKWAAIIGLLALGGVWSRVTPFEVTARCLVAAGAIIVMARSLLARRYAVVAVAGAIVLLYNPLAPLFELSGDWQRAVFVAAAAPFLSVLIWRDMRRRGAGCVLLDRDSSRTKEITNMLDDRIDGETFHEGDMVVLARGTYQGTPGVFVRLQGDVNWAEIRESDGSLWSHPVAWLAHAPSVLPTSVN